MFFSINFYGRNAGRNGVGEETGSGVDFCVGRRQPRASRGPWAVVAAGWRVATVDGWLPGLACRIVAGGRRGWKGDVVRGSEFGFRVRVPGEIPGDRRDTRRLDFLPYRPPLRLRALDHSRLDGKGCEVCADLCAQSGEVTARNRAERWWVYVAIEATIPRLSADGRARLCARMRAGGLLREARFPSGAACSVARAVTRFASRRGETSRPASPGPSVPGSPILERRAAAGVCEIWPLRV